MPEWMANICCGCGRSGFSSGSRQSCNGFVCPHRPDQSAKVDQRQPSRDLQLQSSVFLTGSPASQGEELLSWGSGNTGTPTALRSAALRPLNQSPEHSPAASHTSSLKKTTLQKIRELHVRFGAEAGSFLLSRLMTHQHSSPRLSSSRSSHMVFFRKRIYNTHFLARITELVDRRRRGREKNGRLGSKRGRACTVGCDSGSPGVKPQELLNVKLTRLNMIWQQD